MRSRSGRDGVLSGEEWSNMLSSPDASFVSLREDKVGATSGVGTLVACGFVCRFFQKLAVKISVSVMEPAMDAVVENQGAAGMLIVLRCFYKRFLRYE